MDQAVTADPVGGVQVRRRIKMYKALLGPESAVYGDHVELSSMDRDGQQLERAWRGFRFDHRHRRRGRDQIRLAGSGAEIQTGGAYHQKEEHWKKWIGLYNEKMLSKGTFRDLYVYGYDAPEATRSRKTARCTTRSLHLSWKGEIELRGLKPGSYHVTDYAEGKDLGPCRHRQ